VFDACNRMTSTGDSAVVHEYWDVGILHAWNSEDSTFGNGSIQKLYAALPRDVSLANPSFAKTSGNIIAFDMYNMRNSTCRVVTRNIETGDEATIGIASVGMDDHWGYPSFSLDDRTLIHTYWSSSDTTPYLATLPLDSTAMATVGDIAIKKSNAVAPTWFGTGGVRDIGVTDGLDARASKPATLHCLRRGTATELRFTLPGGGRYGLRIYAMDGRLVYEHTGRAEAGVNRLVWNNVSSGGRPVARGFYVADLRGREFRRTKRFLIAR
jgi:hypothetical protein